MISEPEPLRCQRVCRRLALALPLGAKPYCSSPFRGLLMLCMQWYHLKNQSGLSEATVVMRETETRYGFGSILAQSPEALA